MITIDRLVSHFSAPYYVKIDIEGYGSFALDGMSAQPALISFEFHGFVCKTPWIVWTKK